MVDYETTPGATAPAYSAWPAGSRLNRDPARPTLVMFVHPRCPCSRASLNELTALLSRCEGRVAVQIVFFKPAGFDDGWERTGLFETAQRTPGALVFCDEGGVEAVRFGVTISGQSLLYAPDGELLFQGGLTRSRGHEGDNLGRAALASFITTGMADRSRSPVFGCALLNRCPLPQEGEARCSP
jgi:hypothetical protein